jgi:hypothetical protein
MSEIVPESERHKLYHYVPVSIVPIIVATVLILGSLYFEVSGGYAPMNPVIFFTIPLLSLILFMSVETPKTIMMAVGMWFPTLRSKIVAGVTGALGILIGWALVNFSKTAPSILPIATYPFALSSYATAGLQAILSLSPSVSFVLFFFVATGEEFAVILLSKNLANYLFSKGMRNTILACLLGFLGGRIIWAAWHFFSYGKLTQPYLYLSALMLGSMFTITAIFAGMLAKGYFTGKDISSLRVIPILLPIAIMAHWSFDVVLSRLMIIP